MSGIAYNASAKDPITNTPLRKPPYTVWFYRPTPTKEEDEQQIDTILLVDAAGAWQWLVDKSTKLGTFDVLEDAVELAILNWKMIRK